MPEFHHYEKQRMRKLATNLLLYVYFPAGGSARPHALRFKRNGEVWGNLPAKGGWRDLSGTKAEGPTSIDRWRF